MVGTSNNSYALTGEMALAERSSFSAIVMLGESVNTIPLEENAMASSNSVSQSTRSCWSDAVLQCRFSMAVYFAVIVVNLMNLKLNHGLPSL